jgi:hypothetical protein
MYVSVKYMVHHSPCIIVIQQWHFLLISLSFKTSFHFKFFHGWLWWSKVVNHTFSAYKSALHQVYRTGCMLWTYVLQLVKQALFLFYNFYLSKLFPTTTSWSSTMLLCRRFNRMLISRKPLTGIPGNRSYQNLMINFKLHGKQHSLSFLTYR